MRVRVDFVGVCLQPDDSHRLNLENASLPKKIDCSSFDVQSGIQKTQLAEQKYNVQLDQKIVVVSFSFFIKIILRRRIVKQI